MINYYKIYDKGKFSVELLEETKKLGLTPTLEQINDYVLFLNKKYNINNINLKLYQEKGSNGGCYINLKKEIRFYGELNLITVLHELRHYIQFNSPIKVLFNTYEDREEEARGWSSSLFYAIYPEKYMELANQGKIKFI